MRVTTETCVCVCCRVTSINSPVAPSFHIVFFSVGVGLLVVTIWLEFCTSYSSSCHTAAPLSLAPMKPANPGSPGEMAVKTERESSCWACLLCVLAAGRPSSCLVAIKVLWEVEAAASCRLYGAIYRAIYRVLFNRFCYQSTCVFL